MTTVKKPTPLFGWQGGKGRIVNFITESFPDSYGNYYEPFLGSGAVAIAEMLKHPNKRFHLSDYDEEVVNTWQAVKDHGQMVAEILKNELQPITSKEESFRVRNWDRNGTLHLHHPAERAARFIYITKIAFGGSYKYNSKGHCASHLIESKTMSDDVIQNVLRISNLLNSRDVVISQGSFETITTTAEPYDLIYMDPPYAEDYQVKEDGQRNSINFYKQNTEVMSLQGMVQEEATRLTDLGAFVAVSNLPTPTTLKMFDGWGLKTKPHRHTLNNKKVERKDTKWVNEALFINPLTYYANSNYALAA